MPRVQCAFCRFPDGEAESSGWNVGFGQTLHHQSAAATASYCQRKDCAIVRRKEVVRVGNTGLSQFGVEVVNMVLMTNCAVPVTRQR